MLTIRVKRFIKKTGRKLDLNGKETVGFDRTKFECYNIHRRGCFARECRALRNQGNRNRDAPTRNAPVDTSTTNALVVQDEIGGYDWSFHVEEGLTNFALMAYTSHGSSSSYSEREALNKSNLEIIGYQMGLESLEARIVVHEKNEPVYKEDIAFLKYDVLVKYIFIKELKNQLENTLKEKDDLKLKLEKFETSSKNLTKLINNQISTKDKTGLGYDGLTNESDLNYIHVNESKVLDNVIDSVFDSHESDNNQVNDRFKKGEGYHTVLSPYIGNYMPSRDDLSFAGLDNHVFKSKRLWDSFEFKKNACFVCGSFNHLIKDCEFYENKMVEKSVLNNKGKIIGLKEIRPVWDNTTRVNHQSKLTQPHPKRNFVPAAVLTKSKQVPANATKQSSHRAAASVSAARRVNTIASRPNVNDALPTTYSYFKKHLPVRSSFNQKLAAKKNTLNEKVNTAGVNNVTTDGPKEVVSAAKGNRNNVVKSSACWIWRPKGNLIDHISKDNRSYTFKRFDYVDPQGRLKSTMAWVPRETNSLIFNAGNKSNLTYYEEIDMDLLHLEEMLKE
nr:hypothetical protein [Tanacetum cinerariifolium]